MRILFILALWARQDLNLGPHAYQAARSNIARIYLRALQAFRNRRLGARRASGGGSRAPKRRQNVDGERKDADPDNRPLGVRAGIHTVPTVGCDCRYCMAVLAACDAEQRTADAARRIVDRRDAIAREFHAPRYQSRTKFGPLGQSPIAEQLGADRHNPDDALGCNCLECNAAAIEKVYDDVERELRGEFVASAFDPPGPVLFPLPGYAGHQGVHHCCWCDRLNAIGSVKYCPECFHRADRPRAECDCLECVGSEFTRPRR